MGKTRKSPGAMRFSTLLFCLVLVTGANQSCNKTPQEEPFGGAFEEVDREATAEAQPLEEISSESVPIETNTVEVETNTVEVETNTVEVETNTAESVENTPFEAPPRARGRRLQSPTPRSRPSLVLAPNNTESMARIRDQLVSIYVQEGALNVVRASQGLEGDRKVLASGRIGLPNMVSNGDDVLVTWVQDGSLKAAFSSDGGAHFEGAENLLASNRSPRSSPMGAASRVWRHQGQRYAVLVYHTGRQTQGAQYAVVYADGRWNAPVRLDQGSGSWASVIGRDNRTLVVWKDFRTGPHVSWLYAAELSDPRGSWSEEWAIGVQGGDPGLCMTEEETLHIGFQQVFRQMTTMQSTDWGRSFTQPQRVGQSPGLFAHVSCSGQDVAIVYERFLGQGSHRDNTIKTVGVAISRDGGQSFAELSVADDRTSQVSPTGILDGEGGLELLWVDNSAEGTLVYEKITLP